MDIYFRAQTKGYTFAEMCAHTSGDGGDGMGEEVGGLCACSSITELLNNTVMGAMGTDDEVVVFEANELAAIYDGYRVQPIREIARWSIADFRARAYELEEELFS